MILHHQVAVEVFLIEVHLVFRMQEKHVGSCIYDDG